MILFFAVHPMAVSMNDCLPQLALLRLGGRGRGCIMLLHLWLQLRLGLGLGLGRCFQVGRTSRDYEQLPRYLARGNLLTGAVVRLPPSQLHACSTFAMIHVSSSIWQCSKFWNLSILYFVSFVNTFKVPRGCKRITGGTGTF